ncbi:hypothetical protein O9Z70_09110 [Devosia sp. YIM 151766]|uniref:hypothetical protein n=1 Tax=Devosia sp. YIM 151766 TaxID=3017325 RepID=UPI00255C9C4F|nr:hypothetical protein [Devosia sp. YIM 151766]WIY51648.1 hypothetical protein O9Z70_09110 [Devosia sp. YIM 151766]
MLASHALAPVSAGAANLQEYRNRSATGERTILPDSTARAKAGAQPRNEQRQRDRHQDAATPPPPTRSGSSKFAAAVIAGALPPTPKSMEELIRRIGASEIPSESEARLKDIMA